MRRVGRYGWKGLTLLPNKSGTKKKMSDTVRRTRRRSTLNPTHSHLNRRIGAGHVQTPLPPPLSAGHYYGGNWGEYPMFGGNYTYGGAMCHHGHGHGCRCGGCISGGCAYRVGSYGGTASATAGRARPKKNGKYHSAKFERCVHHIKAQNAVSGRKTFNPWAICSRSVGW